MEKPSKLPSAIEFSKSLLKYLVSEEQVERIMAIKDLRYEMIVDRVGGFIDKNFKFLDFLESKKQFNLIHLYTAKQIKDG